MTPERRTVLVGRKTYSVVTALDERRFDEVLALTGAVLQETNEKLAQEDRLLLACFLLANGALEIRDRLAALPEVSDPAEAPR
jgi:hypothetical protein